MTYPLIEQLVAEGRIEELKSTWFFGDIHDLPECDFCHKKSDLQLNFRKLSNNKEFYYETKIWICKECLLARRKCMSCPRLTENREGKTKDDLFDKIEHNIVMNRPEHFCFLYQASECIRHPEVIAKLLNFNYAEFIKQYNTKWCGDADMWENGVPVDIKTVKQYSYSSKRVDDSVCSLFLAEKAIKKSFAH